MQSYSPCWLLWLNSVYISSHENTSTRADVCVFNAVRNAPHVPHSVHSIIVKASFHKCLWWHQDDGSSLSWGAHAAGQGPSQLPCHMLALSGQEGVTGPQAQWGKITDYKSRHSWRSKTFYYDITDNVIGWQILKGVSWFLTSQLA